MQLCVPLATAIHIVQLGLVNPIQDVVEVLWGHRHPVLQRLFLSPAPLFLCLILPVFLFFFLLFSGLIILLFVGQA